MMDPECCGSCVTADDIGLGAYCEPGAVACPYPGCPLHAPHAVCECSYPEGCNWEGHHEA